MNAFPRKNINLVSFHLRKSYLYYAEFIGQIGEDSNSYLQLNSKDACLFVYKKTIYDINEEFKKRFEDDDRKETDFLKKNRMFEVLGLFILFIVGIMLLSEGGHLAHLQFFGNEANPGNSKK